MGLGAAIRVNGVPDTDFDAAALIEVVERAGETTTYTVRLPVTPRDGDLSWLGLEWDAYVGRRWLFSITADRNRGAEEDNDQYYASVSWRF